MKAAVLVGRERVEVQDIPRPSPGPGEVLCQIRYVGICGSDLHAYQALIFPIGTVLGHEFTATIAEVGPGVSPQRLGQRVVIRPSYVCGRCEYCQRGQINLCPDHFGKSLGTGPQGAYAEYIVVQDHMALPLPAEVSDQEGALVEPLACCVHAVRQSRLKLGDKAAILGAGPIGLLMFACARAAGAAPIYVCEKSPARREIARQMGADRVFTLEEIETEPALADLRLSGIDVVFECAGTPATIAAAFQMVKKGGQIVLEGLAEVPISMDQFRWVVKGIDALASIGSHMDEFPIAVELLRHRVIDVTPLISGVIALEEIETRGFQVLSRGGDAIKILVRPGCDTD